MRAACGRLLLFFALGVLASGWDAPGCAAAGDESSEFTGIWWAHESFSFPDGRQEEWEYVVAVEHDGERLTFTDGDGMVLAGTLQGDTGVLRGSYPWSDGTFGCYTLELKARGPESLQAEGSWANYNAQGVPVSGAEGAVSFSFIRAEEGFFEEEGGNRTLRPKTDEAGRNSRPASAGQWGLISSRPVSRPMPGEMVVPRSQ